MRYLGLVLFATVFPAVATVPTPPRDLTDPQSLNSLSNPNAVPVPIADLFYTHSNGGIAWSPDGKEVVISSNLTGRLNLWKAFLWKLNSCQPILIDVAAKEIARSFGQTLQNAFT